MITAVCFTYLTSIAFWYNTYHTNLIGWNGVVSSWYIYLETICRNGGMINWSRIKITLEIATKLLMWHRKEIFPLSHFPKCTLIPGRQLLMLRGMGGLWAKNIKNKLEVNPKWFGGYILFFLNVRWWGLKGFWKIDQSDIFPIYMNLIITEKLCKKGCCVCGVLWWHGYIVVV